MNGARDSAVLFGGVALLERAISYALGTLRFVTPASLTRPTPCPDWDLGALLAHMDDAMNALSEAVGSGDIGLRVLAGQGGGGTPEDVVASLRSRAQSVLGDWAGGGEHFITVGGCPVPASIVSTVGAVEIATHAWDVAQASGHQQPIPDSLAGELLGLAPIFVTDADRPARFAAAVPVQPGARPSDRLVAYLGRAPR
ncbi:MAG TPA: TIGR03086 family metal-binding protein [Streptosporangiaceae bacterium]|jgi:uncharacterized protein (TIGR03086 family)|nr:TIGR03086 family metal-binding protein [Streptosporangiaceae bacterium]